MAEVRIRLRDDGPLVIEGPAVIVDAEGNHFRVPGDKPNVALCRCGHSRQKPFCDGAHRQCGFSSRERALRTL
jgi:CDGSH-type Zn-finger protein